MLAGSGGRVAPLALNGYKVQRVVEGNVVAEALSLQMAMSHNIYLREIPVETLGMEAPAISIKSFVDSYYLYQAAKLTKSVVDRGLRLDITKIQECVKESMVKIV